MKTKGRMFMAIDQYDITFHGLKHPRKDLMDLVGVKHSSKMYVELKSGGSRHVGYVVGGRWFRLYEIIPFAGK